MGRGRRRSHSLDSASSYDSRGSGHRRGAKRGRSPRRGVAGVPAHKGARPDVRGPIGGGQRKFAPSLVTPTNRSAPFAYSTGPTAMVAQAAPFGAHQLVTYQQQYQPAPGLPAAPHHQLYTQQQMLAQQQMLQPAPVAVVPQPAIHHVAAAAPSPRTPIPLSVPHGMAHHHGHASPVVEPAVDAADLYRTLCSSNDEVLPAGWEKIVYNGQIIYLDHLNREAHDEHPYKIWARGFAATQQQ